MLTVRSSTCCYAEYVDEHVNMTISLAHNENLSACKFHRHMGMVNLYFCVKEGCEYKDDYYCEECMVEENSKHDHGSKRIVDLVSDLGRKWRLLKDRIQRSQKSGAKKCSHLLNSLKYLQRVAEELKISVVNQIYSDLKLHE